MFGALISPKRSNPKLPLSIKLIESTAMKIGTPKGVKKAPGAKLVPNVPKAPGVAPLHLMVPTRELLLPVLGMKSSFKSVVPKPVS